MKQQPARKCIECGHSMASHQDGIRCLLCDCWLRPAEQQSFSFRSALPHGHLRVEKNRKDDADNDD